MVIAVPEATLLLALGALAVLSMSADCPISCEVGYSSQEQADGRRVEASLPVGLLHQFEGYRGDQYPRTYGHHDGDDPLGGTGVETDERSEEECCASYETPEPRY